MKMIKIYTVIHHGSVKFETLSQDEALKFATAAFNDDRVNLKQLAVAPEIYETDREPVDWTKSAVS